MNSELQAASERWKREGQEHKKAINEWLDHIYIHKENPTTDCPEETRNDMASYVLDELIKHNEEGRHKEFRDLFPPDNDPLSSYIRNDNIWRNVWKVALLDDYRIIAKLDDLHTTKLGDYYQWEGVCIINGDEISLIDDLIGFGFSHDKKYFAKVYENRIDIHQGWDGVITLTLSLPDNAALKELQYHNIEVFSTGKQVVLVTHKGIFLIDENGFELIHGKVVSEGEEEIAVYRNPVTNFAENPERPATVPAEAVWNSNENEWELGKKNAAGNKVGEWKWWLAPTGHLCCHTFYEGEDGNIFTFTRFHPDGTPSRIGKYINVQAVGEDIRIRSDNPTTELFSSMANINVWKTVSIAKYGFKIEEHYYDKDDNEVQEAYISNTKISELLKKNGIANRLYIERDWKHLLNAATDIIESDAASGDHEELIRANYYRLYALYQLNNKNINDEQIQTADVILDLYNFELWPYLTEHCILRTSIRFAYYVKAQTAIDSEDYEGAWKQLKKVFDIVSPIDDETELVPYKAMKSFLAAKTHISTVEEEKRQYQSLDYPHAAISPDDKYIALGSKDSAHIVLEQQNGKWEAVAVIKTQSPVQACFNKSSNPLLALGATFPITLGVYVNEIKNMGSFRFNVTGMWVYVNEEEGKECFEMDSDSIFVSDDQNYPTAMFSFGEGILFGDDDGWISFKITNKELYYIYIGGAILSIDSTSDGKYIVVGTASGQIVLLRHETVEFQQGKNQRLDPYLVTNMPVIDEKRYIFRDNAEPLIW